MVPTRKWPKWLSTPSQFFVKVAVALTVFRVMDQSMLIEFAFAMLACALVDYLWCARDGRPALRTIAPGDPKPWQLWRWMDISGPTATANIAHGDMAHTELYLRRLYVLRTPWFGVMLHWIKREDWDRDALHDHPWEFWRFIVSGGYTEEVAYPTPYGSAAWTMPIEELPKQTTLQPSKMVTHRWLRASKFPTGAYHRITSVKPRTVSLVINGPKSNSWGFFVPGTGKVPWRDYVNGAR